MPIVSTLFIAKIQIRVLIFSTVFLLLLCSFLITYFNKDVCFDRSQHV